MTINIKNISSKLKYFLIFLYILLVYIFNANENFTIAYKIPMFLFISLEMISMLKRKKIEFPINIIVLYLFVFYCFLSNFWAINSEHSINMSKTLFLLTTFLLFLYNFLYYERESNKKILNIIMYAGILFSGYIILYYGINNYFNMLFQGIRIGAEIDNVNSIGLETSITFLVSLYLALNTNNKYCYLLSVLPLIVSIGTGSRKVILVLLIGSLLLLFLKSEKRNLKNIIKKIFLIILFIIIVFFIAYIFAEASIFERLEGLTNVFTGKGKVDGSTLERQKFIKYGLMQFRETPLFGIGVSNSGYITMKASGWFTYLHNNFVELLATTGIIGFLLYYYNYFYIFKEILKKKCIQDEDKKIKVLVLSIFAILLLLDYGMVSYYNKATYIYFLIGLSFIKKEDNDVKKNN